MRIDHIIAPSLVCIICIINRFAKEQVHAGGTSVYCAWSAQPLRGHCRTERGGAASAAAAIPAAARGSGGSGGPSALSCGPSATAAAAAAAAVPRAAAPAAASTGSRVCVAALWCAYQAAIIHALHLRRRTAAHRAPVRIWRRFASSASTSSLSAGRTAMQFVDHGVGDHARVCMCCARQLCIMRIGVRHLPAAASTSFMMANWQPET